MLKTEIIEAMTSAHIIALDALAAGDRPTAEVFHSLAESYCEEANDIDADRFRAEEARFAKRQHRHQRGQR